MAGFEGVYRAGTNPGGSPALPGAGAEAFGAGIGQAVAATGDALHRAKVEEKRLEVQQTRQNQAADAGVQLATIQGETSADVAQMRDNAGPGAAGHRDAVAAHLDHRLETFLGGITDERVRNAYRQQAADYRARVFGEEDGWERRQGVEYRVQNIDTQGTLLANEQAARPTIDGMTASLGQIASSVAMQELPANVRQRVVREQQRKVVVAWGNATQLTDHEGLIRVLDAGTLNGYLEPDDIDRLRSGALVEGRRQEAAARAVQAQGEAQARETVRLFNARISAGDQPSDAEFDATRQLATQFGLGVEVFNLGVSQSRVLINRETRDWTPSQFEATINALRAKGDKRSTGENVRLEQLEAIRPSRVQQFNSDPQGHAANIGNPAPALDLGHPTTAAVNARVTWAQGYAQANGMVDPPYLSALELKPFQDRVQQGPAGRLEVAQTLRATFGAAIASRIARQVDPNNRALFLATGLPTTTANTYTRGLDALGRNRALSDAAQEQEVFAEVAPAIPQALRTPVFEAARAIAAGLVDNQHGDKWNEDTYRNALHLALGATSGNNGNLVGGIGYWNRGPLWLPPGVGQAELERRVSRANGEAMARAAGGNGAHYYDTARNRVGRDVYSGEIRSMQWETVRPGVYRVRGPVGGYLVDSKGRPWELDVGKLR